MVAVEEFVFKASPKADECDPLHSLFLVLANEESRTGSTLASV